MNEFLIKNGLIVSGSANISGSVTALSFVGSITGSASTASYVNPLTQNVFVSGAFTVTGPSAGGYGIVNINGTTPGFTNGDAYLNFNNSFLFQHNQQGSSFNFKQGSTFIWNSRNGNLLVGNTGTAPSARLHISGSGTTSATSPLLVQNGSGFERFRIYDDGTAAFNTSQLYISSSGKISVGSTTNAGYALEVYDTQDYNTAHVIASENLRKPTIIEALEEALPDKTLYQIHR